MPYDPSTNPYTMNPRELPSNPAAAAAVPKWNTIDPTTGNPYLPATFKNWAYSPYYTPNWGNQVGTTPGTPGAQATSPVSTASATVPDATLTDRQATKVPTVVTSSPASAVHAVAGPVTITGYGFTGATAVNIGGACTAVTVVNDGTITCTTPAASVAGTANVVVTTPSGAGTLIGGMVYS
jgi:hypothetical protein